MDYMPGRPKQIVKRQKEIKWKVNFQKIATMFDKNKAAIFIIVN